VGPPYQPQRARGERRGAGGPAGPKGQAGWAAVAVAAACCLLVWAGARAGCCGLHVCNNKFLYFIDFILEKVSNA
jgi:hypothetical protein